MYPYQTSFMPCAHANERDFAQRLAWGKSEANQDALQDYVEAVAAAQARTQERASAELKAHDRLQRLARAQAHVSATIQAQSDCQPLQNFNTMGPKIDDLCMAVDQLMNISQRLDALEHGKQAASPYHSLQQPDGQLLCSASNEGQGVPGSLHQSSVPPPPGLEPAPSLTGSRESKDTFVGSLESSDTGTWRCIHEQLRSEDHRCIFVARRLSKLGLRSESVLWEHFSRFGAVKEILVPQSGGRKKIYTSGNLEQRKRPGNLGFIVMQSPECADRVLAQGELQLAQGTEIQVLRFEPHNVNLGHEQSPENAALDMNLVDSAYTGITRSSKADVNNADRTNQKLMHVLSDVDNFISPLQAGSLTYDQALQVTELATSAQQALSRLETEYQHKITEGLQGLMPFRVSAMPFKPCQASTYNHLGLGVPQFSSPATPLLSPSSAGMPTASSRMASSLDPLVVNVNCLVSMPVHRSSSNFGQAVYVEPDEVATAEADARLQDKLLKHLTAVSDVDPDCIFVCRQINVLGLQSHEVLMDHYSAFGEVKHVYVAHSKMKMPQYEGGERRMRPGDLGIVVMSSAAAVRCILAQGEHQVVAGRKVLINALDRPPVVDMRKKSGPDMEWWMEASDMADMYTKKQSKEENGSAGGSSGHAGLSTTPPSTGSSEEEATTSQKSDNSGLWAISEEESGAARSRLTSAACWQ